MGQLRVVITGGGTGGHLFPGIAVAQEMIARPGGAQVTFVGTGRQVDRNAFAQYGFTAKTISCTPLKGGTIISKIKTLLRLPLSLLESILLLRRIKPHLVLGVGGYVTGPVVLGAKILGVPCCIHEQNSVPGLANRKLDSVVDRIFLSMPGSEKYFNQSKCFLSGNPVRREILLIAEKATINEPTLLIIGGSQGAHYLNTLLPEALASIDLPGSFKVVHQTGSTDQEMVKSCYQKFGIKAEVRSFIDDMAACYEHAALVVSRAGATTLAELAALKKPALLIPFPYATDDHQRKNAEVLVKAGAARMFIEKSVNAEMFGREIAQILQDSDLRRQMAESAAGLAKPKAAESIVDECMKLINKQGYV